MIRRQKLLIGFAGAAGLLLIALLALNYLASTFINLTSVKSKLQTAVSHKVGGAVDYQTIDISLFPLAHAVIREVSLSIPGKARGTIEQLDIYPELWPLFTGRLLIDGIRLESPDIEMALPQKPREGDKGKEPLSVDRVRDVMAGLTAFLSPDAPVFSISVDNGSVRHTAADGNAYMVQNVHSQIDVSANTLDMKMSCSSNVWDALSVRVHVNRPDAKAVGEFAVNRFHPQVIIDRLVRHSGDGSDARKAAIEGSSIKGAFSLGEEAVQLSLAEMKLDYPDLLISGNLFMDIQSRKMSLELTAKDLDVARTAQEVLELTGNNTTVRGIFRVLKGGAVPELAFSSNGQTFGDLIHSDNYVIRGTLRDGDIFVPGPELELTSVAGDVVVKEGILEGSNIDSRLEDARGSNGMVRIGLAGGDAQLHVATDITADVSGLPPLFRQFIKDETFLSEMEQIYRAEGTAMGRLVIGDVIGSVSFSIDVSEVNLSADYRRLPYPLTINGGRFSYDEASVSVTNLSGSMGASSFSGLSAQLSLDQDNALVIDSGNASVSVDEVYPWIASFEKPGEKLEIVKALKGTLEIDSLNLNGPVLMPDRWNFSGNGFVKELTVETTLLPDALVVASGDFSIDTGKLSLSDNRIQMMDSALTVSGSLKGYQQGLDSADLIFSGEMGQEITDWMAKSINFPSELYVQTPLSIDEAHLLWNKNVETALKGRFRIQDGPRVTLDMVQTDEMFRLNDLSIEDDESRASTTLMTGEGQLKLDFSGNLTRKTMDAIFVNPLVDKEWIEGDFHFHAATDRAVGITARGTLRGENIHLPKKLKFPFRLNSFSLSGAGDRVHVDSAAVQFGNSLISVKGDVAASKQEIIIDADLKTDRINWTAAKQLFAGEDEKEEQNNLWESPVRGTVRFQSDEFTLDPFQWENIRADIEFSREAVNVAVADALLCGVSTPGHVTITPLGQTLDFQPVAQKGQAEPAIACLLDIDRYMTGTFDLEGSVIGKGTGQELVDSLDGSAELIVKDGRIYQYGVLAKVLAFINVTEVLRGQMPDMVKEGFAYSSITMKGDFVGSKLVLKEFVIDGASMEIASLGSIDFREKTVDLKVLVAPLKTVDFIIKKTPIVRDILGGTLVSIPVRVRGDYRNPTITYLSPVDIGSGLLDILTNVVKTPVKIIHPASPASGEKNGKTD